MEKRQKGVQKWMEPDIDGFLTGKTMIALVAASTIRRAFSCSFLRTA
jgi:hypothetical protein